MASTDTTAALVAALAALDFEQTNSEIGRLDAERKAANAKAEEAEADALRLASEIRDWSLDPDALADAVLAGASPAEAAQAAPSRDHLVERRNALLAAASALRDRAERARRDRDEVAASQCIAIAEAAGDFIEELAEKQRGAASTIMEADAAMRAIQWITNGYIAPVLASGRARKGLTGMDSILGHVDRVQVPSAVVEALKPLEARAKGLRAPVPVTLSNN